MPTILIADDDAVQRLVLRQVLAGAGHTLLVAANGQEACAAAADATLDLALLDAWMPDLTGFEVARRLRDAGQTCPLVILTADEPYAREQGGDAPIDHYLSKPLPASRLLAFVREQLGDPG